MAGTETIRCVRFARIADSGFWHSRTGGLLMGLPVHTCAPCNSNRNCNCKNAPPISTWALMCLLKDCQEVGIEFPGFIVHRDQYRDTGTLIHWTGMGYSTWPSSCSAQVRWSRGSSPERDVRFSRPQRAPLFRSRQRLKLRKTKPA